MTNTPTNPNTQTPEISKPELSTAQKIWIRLRSIPVINHAAQRTARAFTAHLANVEGPTPKSLLDIPDDALRTVWARLVATPQAELEAEFLQFIRSWKPAPKQSKGKTYDK